MADVLSAEGQWAAGIIFRMAEGGATGSDEALAARVRESGDEGAFTLLVTRYRTRLVALVRRMLTGRIGPEEAEDIAQESFITAYDKRASYRRGEPFRPWLYRIAINRCLDRLRAQSRRPAPLEWDAITEPVADGSDPAVTIMQDEREARLQEAVAALPPKYRAVFLLRHLDDLSYEEIASATDLPLGTVKTHLFRARAQLRQALTGYWEE